MGDDPSELGMLAALTQGAGTLLWLGLEIALIVIAMGAVRRHRPEVAGLLASAGAIMAVTTLASPLAYAGVALAVAGSGDVTGADIARMHVFLGLLLSLVRGGAFAMILAGVAQLASPRRADPREPA